jgi:hypothetical protein
MKGLQLTGISLLMFAAGICFLFAGCDGDGDGNGDSDVSPSTGAASPVEQSEGSEDTIDVTGTWDGYYNYASSSSPLDYRFVLVQSGSSITGTGTMPSDSHSLLDVQGTISGDNVILKFTVWGDTIWWDLTVSGDTMAGTFNDSSRSWSGAASFTR